MAIREIVLYPDAPLRQRADEIDRFDGTLTRLINDMFETMVSDDGCGLAAPQVGVAKRLLVLHDPDTDTRMVLINPEITESEGQETREEGCLSLPGVYAPVVRAKRIHVKALDKHGKPLDFDAEDLLARIIQHEMDHLDGLVFLDRVDVLTHETKIREWEEARAELMMGDAAGVGGTSDGHASRTLR